MRDTGVLARRSEPNSVAVSNWADRTDCGRRGLGQRARPLCRAERGKAPHLEHGQEQMLLAALVLVAVKREHDRLQQDVDLGHRDQAAERRDVPRLGLEQEEEVAVGLQGASARRRVSAAFRLHEEEGRRPRDAPPSSCRRGTRRRARPRRRGAPRPVVAAADGRQAQLERQPRSRELVSSLATSRERQTHLVRRHPVLNEERDARVEVADVALKHEVLLGLGRDLALEVAQAFLGWASAGVGEVPGELVGGLRGRERQRPQRWGGERGGREGEQRGDQRTSSEVILDLHVDLGRHRVHLRRQAGQLHHPCARSRAEGSRRGRQDAQR